MKNPGYSAEESNMVEASQEAGVAPPKKRRKKTPKIDEAALSPQPSIWPIVLAGAIALVIIGWMANLFVLGAGIVLVVVAAIGWTQERH